MFRPILVASLAALGFCARIPSISRAQTKHTTVPFGFSYSAAASPDTMLDFRVALAQDNPAGLEAALYDVSTPSSPNYGKHLSKGEAAAYVSPSARSLAAVTSWFQANDINATALTPAGDWMKFSVPISKANTLLGADYAIFTHEQSGKQVIRTLEYSVPEELSSHLDVIHPTTAFPVYRKPARVESGSKASNITARTVEKRVDSSCYETITPSCLQQIYGIPSTPATQQSNKILVTGFVGYYANQADLQSFLQQWRPDMSSSTTFTTALLDGGQNPQTPSDAGDESNLDIQYTVGVATDVPVTFLSVGSDNNDGALGGFLDVVNYLLNEDSPPQVVTTSYDFYEDELEPALEMNLCNAYAQLGARGVSIMFGSGDGGVSGYQERDCTTFIGSFPSTCPYVTSVGGTQGFSPEVAAQFSSGGFSNVFARPSYQQNQVSAYLTSLGSTNSGLYNATGRGFPDVAMQSENFEIVQDGGSGPISGTSAASPSFASVIALLNDQLIAAGKSPLGFLNPLLYSTAASAFNDITSGNNPGCGTDGFYAVQGWDPVTGLGTPQFAALKSAIGL